MDSSWRVWAKVVAIFDMVCVCLNLLLVSLLVVVAIGEIYGDPKITTSSGHFDLEYLRNQHNTSWMILIFTAADILIAGIQMWAAIKLLSAATIGQDFNDALEKARTWRNVTLGFFVLALIGSLGSFNFTAIAALFIVRGLPLFIVYNFMKDLETFIYSPPGCSGKNFV